MTGSTYVVLLPVKPPARGKSRLEVDPATPARAGRGVRPGHRARLPRGRARGRGARRHRRRAVRRRAARGRAARPSPTASTGDLNESLRQAAAEAARRWPDRRTGRACAPTCRPCCPATSTRRWRRRGRGPRSAFVADPTASAPRSTPRRTTRSTRASAPARAQAHLRRRGPRDHAAGLASLRLDVDDRATTSRPRVGARRRARTPGWPLLGLTRRMTKGAARRAAPFADERQDFLAVFFAGAFLAGGLLGRWPSSPAAFLAGGLLARRSSSRSPSWPASSSRPRSSSAGVFLAAASSSPSPAPSSRPSSWPSRSSWPPPSWRRAFFAGAPSSPGRLGRLLRGRRRLLGRGACRRAERQLRQLLGAGDDVLEVRAGGELRHRRLLGLDPRAGLRVAHPAGLADALLERAEAGDRDLLALGHLAGDRVEDGLQRVLRPACGSPRNARPARR